MLFYIKEVSVRVQLAQTLDAKATQDHQKDSTKQASRNKNPLHNACSRAYWQGNLIVKDFQPAQNNDVRNGIVIVNTQLV